MPAQPHAGWIPLLRAPGVSSRTLGALIDHFPDVDALRSAGRSALKDCPGVTQDAVAAVLAADTALRDEELSWLEGANHHLLLRGAPDYPPLLAQISDPPPLLFALGDVQRLGLPQIAVVGSRNPSATGRETAQSFARHLAAGGFTITSGLAQGVDTAAHQGALDGGGHTVAVAGTGLDRVYPASNRELAHQISERGVLVSEFPLGVGPMRSNFPRRNRIISGLSLGVLVVEAALRSGSLITARMASEQGREVFAIPGSIHNPLARGCHRLIRQGAKLVETAADIVEELGGLLAELKQSAADAAPERLSAPQRKVLEALGHDPCTVDQAVERSGLTPAEVSSILVKMELCGLVASVPGGAYCRIGRTT